MCDKMGQVLFQVCHSQWCLLTGAFWKGYRSIYGSLHLPLEQEQFGFCANAVGLNFSLQLLKATLHKLEFIPKAMKCSPFPWLCPMGDTGHHDMLLKTVDFNYRPIWLTLLAAAEKKILARDLWFNIQYNIYC